MCGRFALTKQHLAQAIHQIGAACDDQATLPESHYNITPGRTISAIRQSDAPSGGHELTTLHWGLPLPLLANPSRQKPRILINLRVETALGKPTWNVLLQYRRCLVPVSAFYEWEARSAARWPWAFLQRSGAPFYLGALWQNDHCVILTTEANALMAPIHHRMPVVLTPENATVWLSPQNNSKILHALFCLSPTDWLIARPVSKRINAITHNDEACLREATHDDGQLELF